MNANSLPVDIFTPLPRDADIDVTQAPPSPEPVKPSNEEAAVRSATRAMKQHGLVALALVGWVMIVPPPPQARGSKILTDGWSVVPTSYRTA